MAKDQRTKGDEYHVAAATEWIGSILIECFPERFRLAEPSPAPAEPKTTEGDPDAVDR